MVALKADGAIRENTSLTFFLFLQFQCLLCLPSRFIQVWFEPFASLQHSKYF